MFAGDKSGHVAGFAFDTIERHHQFNCRGGRQDEPIGAARLRQLLADGGFAEIGVHEAVPAFEIQVEGVEHPAGPGKCLQFAALTAQDVPKPIARRAKPATWNRRCCGNDVGQTFIWNEIK